MDFLRNLSAISIISGRKRQKFRSASSIGRGNEIYIDYLLLSEFRNK